MERRTKKMLLAILMIISVLSADFFMFGSGIMTYASELSAKTNNANIEFSVYFKEGETKVDSIQKSIKIEDVKIYAEIKVKNEGYLKEGTVIELENSNFNLKSEIIDTNTHINSIEGNKVKLKQINAGETVEIELGIEPIIREKIEVEFLSKISKVKMIGSYVYSKDEEGQAIITDKEVCINYQPDDTTNAELTTEIITNKELSVSGTNKRMVQLLIKSRITNNEYPVKQTKISADIPVIKGENPEVSVIAINELATNGTTEINDIKISDGEVEITIDNNPDGDNKISWDKNIYDEIVITYIYSDAIKASDVVFIDASVWMNVYNYENPYMAAMMNNQAIGQTIPESNNVIIGREEITTEELYKGKLYTKSELTYNTETEIVITNPNVVEEVVIHEGPDKFGTTESEISVNTKYISTEINLEKMLEIVGQDGNIEIKNGETIVLINKETEVNEKGNVIINYENGTSELYITTSNPVKEGMLEIKHTKVIAENNYTRAQLEEVKKLITKGTLEGNITVNKEKQSVILKTIESGNIELKETKSKAELTIENNKTELSTTQENEITLGITLITNGEQYDLFKNPTMSIKFPEAVEDVKIKTTPTTQNMEEFTNINVSDYDLVNRTIQIELKGEQTAYPISELTQAYLQLSLDITLSKLATDKTDKIIMEFLNENAIQYAGGRTDVGVVEQEVQISVQTGLQKIFNISLNENTSQTETVKQRITSENVGQTITFETLLINNTGSNMNNVKILGKLPTTGNLITGQENVNTFETRLTGINAQNAAIYYTTNADATVENKEAWTTDPTNAKMYLIEIGELNQGSNYSATVNVQIPDTLEEGLESYTEYKVIYDTEYGTNIEEVSRKIALMTTSVSDLQVKLTALVGQEILNNGDIVKEGEVIKYIVTLTNYSEAVMENITLNAGVPEGTVIVDELENYEYLLNNYYEEKTDRNQMSVTIPTLQVGETHTQYEVRVNTDIVNGTEISNKVTATYNNITTQSEEITNKLEEANIRTTIKKANDKSIKLTAGSEVQYDLIIENLSNKTINGLEVEIVSDDFSLEGQEIVVGEIPANGKITSKLKGTINSDADKMNISANVKESNNIYRSNVIMEELVHADATITLTSPQNNTYLKKDDIVEYNIVVENTGNVSEYFKVYYTISNDFDIQSLNINGITVSQASEQTAISNLSYEGLKLNVGERATIDITAKVKNVEETKVITNKAKVEVLNVYKNVSQEIIHTLLPESTTEEDTKNIISGSAWLDANVNGQKDEGEIVLEGIKVKIYDTIAQKYLGDETTSAITQTTDSNGEYVFSKIPNGSYMLVFGYDDAKYELTTYLAEGVDGTLNSKAILKNITIKDEIITVATTEIIEVQDNVANINIGLKEKQTTPSIGKKTITGFAWLDENKNGQKNDNERAISEIKVKVYDASTGDYLKDSGGKIVETTTNSNGEYYLTNIEKGSYKIIFEYDTGKYELTTYLAEGVEDAKSSKAILNKMLINGNEVEIASTDLIELQDDITDINIGLKEKEAAPPKDDGGNEEEGDNEDIIAGNVISGLAWLDLNRDGEKDADETLLQGITVKIYDISTNNYLKDVNGNVVQTLTDTNGKYIFNDIGKGTYILIFEYDTEEYEPTTYFAEGIDTTKNSKVVQKKITINGQEVIATVTDTINLQTNILDINIGLKEKLIYDLELNKYISRIVVQTSKETKAYDYENKTLAKVEIHKKQIVGANVVLEYKIKIKNNGEIAGYAKNIVDYVPRGLTFSSELNKDWYLSGEYLYTKSLENVEIKPGEEKEIKLILTKTMTAENVGLINNSAEIYKDYNQYGESDIDSIPNNQVQNEDDYSAADAIIQIATGGSFIIYVILLIANIALIGVAIKIMIKNNIIKISTKEERR